MWFDDNTEKRILIFGDSNTYGYNTERDGRFPRTVRWPGRLAHLLGEGYAVIEEGLPGRTAVFDDPLTEGLCGLAYLNPCMMSHAPLDTLVIMLGTNDSKARFGCNAYCMAKGIARLADKALVTPAWRDRPDVLVICPKPIHPGYAEGIFYGEMGPGCDERSAALAAELCKALDGKAGVRFFDANTVPGVEYTPIDGMHLTAAGHAALAAAAAELVR
ncbi:MAG: lipolytic enzyme, G-D-S-L [Oscillospiraceae bacterium]|nr:lipolytic enzyme, G-D-S-L [Oscillospiraceae bacterium]